MTRIILIFTLAACVTEADPPLAPAPQTVCPKTNCVNSYDGDAYCGTICGGTSYCQPSVFCDGKPCGYWGICKVQSGTP